MNEFNRKFAHAVANWQAPASTGKKQPAIDMAGILPLFAQGVHEVLTPKKAARAAQNPAQNPVF